MTKFDRQLAIVAPLVPLALLFLKVVEVSTEASGKGFGGTIGLGVLRRLDDGSFWLTVFIAVGCWRIREACERLGALGTRRIHSRREEGLANGAALLVFICLIAGLLTYSSTSAVLFFWPSPEGKKNVQWSEGIAIAAALAIWAECLVVSVRAGEDVRWLVRTQGLRTTMPRKRVREAELIANGCLAPAQLTAVGLFVVLGALAAVGVAEVADPIHKWLDAHLKPTDPLELIGMFALVIAPSALVAGWLRWRWFGLLRWSLGTGFWQRPLWLRLRVDSRQFGT